jgi:hypothetical protein
MKHAHMDAIQMNGVLLSWKIWQEPDSNVQGDLGQPTFFNTRHFFKHAILFNNAAQQDGGILCWVLVAAYAPKMGAEGLLVSLVVGIKSTFYLSVVIEYLLLPVL